MNQSDHATQADDTIWFNPEDVKQQADRKEGQESNSFKALLPDTDSNISEDCL
jgi:hypothetical protein